MQASRSGLSQVLALRSTLRISKKNAKKAKRLQLPGCSPVDRLRFGKSEYANLTGFAWYDEDSADAYADGRLASLVALLEGDAELVFVWDDDSITGLRIVDGKMMECAVKIFLEVPETIR